MEALTLCFIFAIFIGWQRGGKRMKQVRENPDLGVKNSTDCGTYIFVDVQ